jgi:hypothetical protein
MNMLATDRSSWDISQRRETEKYSHGFRGAWNQGWLCWRAQHQFTRPDHTGSETEKEEINCTIPRVVKQKKRWHWVSWDPEITVTVLTEASSNLPDSRETEKYESCVPRGPKPRMTFGEGQQQFTGTKVSHGQSGSVETPLVEEKAPFQTTKEFWYE